MTGLGHAAAAGYAGVSVSGLDFTCEIVMAWRADNTNPCLRTLIDYLSDPSVFELMRSGWIANPGLSDVASPGGAAH